MIPACLSRTHGSTVATIATVTFAKSKTSISDCSTVATVATVTVAVSAKHCSVIGIDGSSHFSAWGSCDSDSCDFCDSWRVQTSSKGLICTCRFLPSCTSRARPNSDRSLTASAHAAFSRKLFGPRRCTSRVGTVSVFSRRQ